MREQRPITGFPTFSLTDQTWTVDDGLPDLAVGTPDEVIVGKSGAGAVFTFTWHTTAGLLLLLDQSLTDRHRRRSGSALAIISRSRAGHQPSCCATAPR